MSLEAGTRLGSYEISSLLGKGGMGEVYRARDTRLGREVAIKVLPEEVAGDPERLVRFEREARVLASLNHPNIAVLHGFFRGTPVPGAAPGRSLESPQAASPESFKGTPVPGAAAGRSLESPQASSPESDSFGAASFLVMELIEGETLADRLARGPIPVDEAVALFGQIAEGLEAAHERGVIHRDLKPANVKLGADGESVKILDFGLAKAMAPEAAVATDLPSMSPTLTLAATQRGEILGTAAYMSPEQARGREVDKRCDIWAFGVCLWEALTGRRLFSGADAAQTLARVLEREPDLEALPPATPARLRELIERCLVKNPRDRLRDIGDARTELRRVVDAKEAPMRLEPLPSRRRPPVRAWLALVLLGGVAGFLAASLLRRESEPARPLRRYSIVLPENQDLSGDNSLVGLVGAQPTFSPDGTRLIWSGRVDGVLQLVERGLADAAPRPIPGTTGGQSPFFSPDGEWIGFFADGRLKTIRRGASTAVDLAAALPVGGAWSRDGDIYFVTSLFQGVYRIAAAGGEPELAVPAQEGDLIVSSPQLIADDSVLLFSLIGGREEERWSVWAFPLATGQRQRLVESALGARFLDSGYLLWARRGELLAAPFDPVSLSFRGEALPVTEDSMRRVEGSLPVLFDVSSEGTLAFVPAGLDLSSSFERVPVWLWTDGRATPTGLPPVDYIGPRISPDGRRFAYSTTLPSDIYVRDFSGGQAVRLTFTEELTEIGPLWSPEGERILYTVSGGVLGLDGPSELVVQRADGAGEPEVIARLEAARAWDWSPDGSEILLGQRGDLTALTVETGAVRPLVESDEIEGEAAFSPDGRFFLYQEGVENEIRTLLVRPFPDASRGRWEVGRGRDPAWSPDGSYVLFRRGDSFYRVPISTKEGFHVGDEEVVAEGASLIGAFRMWDVAPKGDRLLVLQPVAGAAARTPGREIEVVEGWTDALKQRLRP